MFAYLPARGGSKRIPRKNIRPLGGKPLLAHVLDVLSAVRGLKGIAVSSEDPEIRALAGSRPEVVTLAPREARLSDDRTGFLELVCEDVPRFATHFADQELMFVTATAALVPATAFEAGIARFRANPRGLTLGVTEFQPSAVLALAGAPHAELKPLFPELYTLPTGELPRTFVDAGCFYFMDLRLTTGIRRFLDLTPVQAVVLPPEVGIDLDTPEDWRRLEAAFQAKSAKSRSDR